MGETITCTRRIAWDAMHRLPNHDGPCRAFHGHRYAAEFTCTAAALNAQGMVIDFGIVKDLVGDWINDKLDHTAILSRHDDDPAVRHIIASNAASGRPVYLMDGAPTAENIARELASVATRLLAPFGVRVTRVTVWETPNCYATWSAS